MEKIKLIYGLLLFACCSFTISEVFAQSVNPLTKEENERIDSLKMLYDAEEVKAEKFKNKENLSDLKSEKTESKLQAKEAKRIERDANNAARESRMAYRSEKLAQKSRVRADKQAKKAAKARSVSNQN